MHTTLRKARFIVPGAARYSNHYNYEETLGVYVIQYLLGLPCGFAFEVNIGTSDWLYR